MRVLAFGGAEVDDFHRSGARIIYDPTREEVYLEVTAQHDGVSVTNAYKVTRAAFSAKVRNMGVL